MKFIIPPKIAIQEAFETIDFFESKLNRFLSDLELDRSSFKVVNKLCDESQLGFCVIEYKKYTNCIFCGYKYSE